MDMSGEYRIAASKPAVWAALNDPEILKSCIPGCESLERVGEELVATVVAKIGPVKAKFSGKVSFENVDAPNGYSIIGEGQGGVAGFAKGGADVALSDDGEATLLRYTAKAQVGGKIAQLGSRLIDSTAKSMAEQFFSAFSERVASEASAADALPETGGEIIAEKEAALADVVRAAEALERRLEAKVEGAAAKGGPSTPMLWAFALVLLGVALLLLLGH